jgi:hypothetical protein
MSILGVVAGLVYPIVTMTINVMIAFERETEVLRVGNSVLDLISRDIQGCYANPDPANPRLNNVFVGKQEMEFLRLDFITTTISHPDEDGYISPLTEVGYHIYRNNESKMLTLFRREDKFEYSGDYTAGGQYYEVYDRFSEFTVEYFDGSDWVESWEEETNPPLAVKVSFVVVPPDIGDDKIAFSDSEFEEQLKRDGGFESVINIPCGSKSKAIIEAEGGNE